jgi:hypothetical protein
VLGGGGFQEGGGVLGGWVGAGLGVLGGGAGAAGRTDNKAGRPWCMSAKALVTQLHMLGISERLRPHTASTPKKTLTTAASALSKVEAAQSSCCQASCSSSEACIVVECHLTALVVVTDVWVEVALVGSTHQSTTQGYEGGVGVDEVALCAAAASTDACCRG